VGSRFRPIAIQQASGWKVVATKGLPLGAGTTESETSLSYQVLKKALLGELASIPGRSHSSSAPRWFITAADTGYP